MSIRVENVKVEIGGVTREAPYNQDELVARARLWDETLLKYFDIDAKPELNVPATALTIMSLAVKLAKKCKDDLSKLVSEYGPSWEVKLPDMNRPTPITSLVTGLEPKTLSDLLEVPELVRQQLLALVENYTDNPLFYVHAMLHASTLILTLLESSYVAQLVTYGCVQEGDACLKHPMLTDPAVRGVGVDVVSGTIPGIVVAVCTTRQIDVSNAVRVLRELAQRNFLVIVSGLLAKILEVTPVEGDQTLFDLFPERIVKCTPLLGALHYVGVLIRAAEIFAGKKIPANYPEIANYILTKIGVALAVWGPPPIEILPIALAAIRLGVSTIVTPVELPVAIRAKIRKWTAQDTVLGKTLEVEHAPHVLLTYVKTPEDMITEIVRACLRPCDNSKCRLAKLSHYVDVYVRLKGTLPPDLPEVIRTEAEVPLALRERAREILGPAWREREVPVDLKLFTE